MGSDSDSFYGQNQRHKNEAPSAGINNTSSYFGISGAGAAPSVKGMSPVLGADFSKVSTCTTAELGYSISRLINSALRDLEHAAEASQEAGRAMNALLEANARLRDQNRQVLELNNRQADTIAALQQPKVAAPSDHTQAWYAVIEALGGPSKLFCGEIGTEESIAVSAIRELRRKAAILDKINAGDYR